MSATEPYAALIDGLARRVASSLGWDWPSTTDGAGVHPSGPDTIRPEIELVLDDLLALGWRPPTLPSGIVVNVQPAPEQVRYVPVPVVAERWLRR